MSVIAHTSVTLTFLSSACFIQSLRRSESVTRTGMLRTQILVLDMNILGFLNFSLFIDSTLIKRNIHAIHRHFSDITLYAQ